MIKIEYKKKHNSNREIEVRGLINEAARYTGNVRDFQGVFSTLLDKYSDSFNAHNKQANQLYFFKKDDKQDSIDDDDYSEITEGFIVYRGPDKFRVICKLSNE